MKTNTNLKYTLVTAIVLLMSMGCTDDMDRVGSLAPTDVIRFSASLGDNLLSGTTSRSTSGFLSIVEEDWKLEAFSVDTVSSRASLTTSLDDSSKVFGYIDNVPAFNETFTFNKDELISASPIYWKNILVENAQKLTIYAYAPASLGFASETFTLDIKDAEAQKDIIVAKTEVANAGFRKTIPLTFNHALTAVQFQLGEDIDADEVKSITISGVHKKGTYTIGGSWSIDEKDTTYTTMPGNLLLLMPQTLPENAKVMLTYTDDRIVTTSLAGKKWEAGKLITYTLYEGKAPGYIYLDLAAGNVKIDAKKYSGAYYQKNGESEPKLVTLTSESYSEGNKFYVYQSTERNRNITGMIDGTFKLPSYPTVMVNDRTWSDYITNNPNVEDVIETWDNEINITGQSAQQERSAFQDIEVVRDAGRTHTSNYISINGGVKCNLTIDNLYSTYQDITISGGDSRRNSGGLTFLTDDEEAELEINIVGDNRLGAVHYHNMNEKSEMIFEGSGSLTVADVDFKTTYSSYQSLGSYSSNFWFAAIGGGNNVDGSIGITINGGVIFAGTTKTDDCTAIGGGGNKKGKITINGGVVTAVATTKGAAIGGGCGYTVEGGPGDVTITGGSVYAYNHENQWNVPSAAIGGGGSISSKGAEGIVTISGGNVYAYSVEGTAIGGGSSATSGGGRAEVKIHGGNIIAISTESDRPAGAGIGGGTGGTTFGSNGGTATVTISGNPVVRTGSVGGGKTNNTGGTIGSAIIQISDEPDIQAQFVLAKGTASGAPNSFEMNGGTIRNSNTADDEYIHIRPEGGAVYIEEGSCSIYDGTIKNCTATHGGAIYIKGGTVTMTGGTISDNLAKGGHGGGIYIKEGSFFMPEGGTAKIIRNSSIMREGEGGNGGGLYVTSDVSDVRVDILSGTISENTSDHKGGGVCVDMSGTSQAAHVKVGTSGMTNPDISANHTLLSGGGLYVSGRNANITINGGKIMNNTTSAYVANVNVANEGGMVTLYEGDVTHNVVTFYANGGQGGPQEQNIVTATNSLLVAPTFTRVGYSLVGWNTRADGRGDSYTDGQVMNISKDLELYAQWELD